MSIRIAGNIISGAKDSTVVHNTGDETIAGTKTFSTSPVLPTPSTNDNSTKGATTAYVKSNLSNYQTKNTAVSHTASTAVGSSSQPVYIASDGTATAIDFKLWVGTQAQYDAITTKDQSTLYFIKES